MVQKGSKGSNTNKTPWETSDLDNTSDPPGNKKQKQTPLHRYPHPQSSTGLPANVDFKCRYKYQRILRGEMEIYSESACHKKCVGNYLDRTSPVSDFPPERSD